MSHIVGASESSRFRLEPRPSHGLPRTAFLSDEIFEVEWERIFSRYWLSLIGADGLRDVGACRVVDWPRRPVVIARGQDGQLRGFDNVCRHRGCRLLKAGVESHGGAFRCPYHGWTYRDDGRLAAVPNAGDEILSERERLGLNTFAVEECCEQIFVRFSQEEGDLPIWLQPLLSNIAPWFASPLFCAHRIPYEIEANWKLVFQNFNECYHCRFVHPGLNALTRFDTASNDLVEGPILGGPMILSDGVESMTASGRLCGAPFSSLDPHRLRRVYYFTVFPNLFISPHPDYVMTHRLIPLSRTRTRIECEFWFQQELADGKPVDATGAADFWDSVNREDWYVCEQTQAGVQSMSFEPGPYAATESMVAEFDRYYRSVMRGVDWIQS